MFQRLRARVLAGGLRLVTEGYIRSPPLPPTLLVDRGDTPALPPPDPLVDPRPTPARIRSTDLYVSTRFFRMFKNNVFYRVSWPSAATTFA